MGMGFTVKQGIFGVSPNFYFKKTVGVERGSR